MKKRGIPWILVAGLVLGLWVTTWVGGWVGSRTGTWYYHRYLAPAPPFTTEEIETMRLTSPSTAAMAEQQYRVWEGQVELSTSVSSVQGSLIGSVVVLAIWVTGTLVWMWMRERRRQLEAELEGG